MRQKTYRGYFKKMITAKRIFQRLSILILILALTVAFLPACSGNGLYTVGNGELKVVCTSFPPFDLARQVGGEKVTLTVLQDNGADLHNYSPTAKTLLALSEADVFIAIGGESDKKWVDDAIESAQNPDLKVIYLTDGIELKHAELERTDHGEGHDHSAEHGESGDEHVWLSLKNAISITEKICAAFTEKDAESSAYYRANATAFTEKLSALDREYEKAVAESDKKTVVVADRFPFIYLTDDYGLSYYAAFSGCSTEVNSDFATQIKLINAVKEHDLHAIIVTEGGGKDLADNICSETGCKKVALNSMQSVTRAEIESGATYIGIMTKNLASLKAALSQNP